MNLFLKSFIFLLLAQIVAGGPIVFIHLGTEVPEHLPLALAQARIFNPDSSIYVVAPRSLLHRFQTVWQEERVVEVPLASLIKSDKHWQFLAKTRLDRHSLGGFWLHTAERFFVLEELMRREGLEEVFHLENDLMLYEELDRLLPSFQIQCGPKIGATFERDDRCVPGFLYVPKVEPLEALTQFMTQRARLGETDMAVLASFRKERGEWIEFLPILPDDWVFKAAVQFEVADRSRYASGFEQFGGVFDAAALGQFLGGAAPLHQEAIGSGYINPYAWYTVAGLSIDWEEDEQGRKIPFLHAAGKRVKIFSLHIHSKNLAPFLSGKGGRS